MSTAIVVGDPEPGSETLRAAAVLASLVTGEEATVQVDLAQLGRSLFDGESKDVAELISAIGGCNLVVVASPVVTGSFSGLLKLFLDRLPPGFLTGVNAIPLMVGRRPRDEMAAETFLRPVLTDLGAAIPTGSVFLLESETADCAALDSWVRRERHRLPTRLDLLTV